VEQGGVTFLVNWVVCSDHLGRERAAFWGVVPYGQIQVFSGPRGKGNRIKEAAAVKGGFLRQVTHGRKNDGKLGEYGGK